MSTILYYLDYCLEVWGNTYKSNTNKIVILQKKAIRLINHADFRAHTNNLFKKMNILKFYDLVNLKICTVVHKALKKEIPMNLVHLLNFTKNTSYNTRNSSKLYHKYVRTNLKKFCISVSGVLMFNNLKQHICNSDNVKVLHSVIHTNLRTIDFHASGGAVNK